MSLSLQDVWQQLLPMRQFALLNKNENFKDFYLPVHTCVPILENFSDESCDILLLYDEMYQHLESLFLLSEPRFSNISHWEWLCHEGLTEMAHVFMLSFGEHNEVGQICRIWPLHEARSVKKPKTAQMFWPDGLSIGPFNEKWESTNGADREVGRLKENDVLLLAGSWYEIVLILHQIFWQEAKLNEAFCLGMALWYREIRFPEFFFSFS